MRRFTRLYLDLDSTAATTEKVALLEAYFAEASDPAPSPAPGGGGGPRSGSEGVSPHPPERPA